MTVTIYNCGVSNMKIFQSNEKGTANSLGKKPRTIQDYVHACGIVKVSRVCKKGLSDVMSKKCMTKVKDA